MFRHYLMTIARNLARSKLVSLMHVAGLSVGIACFMVSFVLIEELRTSDMHFRNSGRIYALTQELWMGRATKPVAPARPIVTAAAAPYLKADFPQLEGVARAMRAGGFGSAKMAFSTGDRNLFLYPVLVDPDFLRIFDLPIVAGDGASALASANGAIITAAAARKAFGTTDVVGRRLLFANSVWVTIRAVTSGVPQPSHMGDTDESVLRFDILMRLVPEAMGQPDWASPVCMTYVLLPARGALTPEAFSQALTSFSDRHMPRSVGHSRFAVVPVSAIRMSFLDAAFASTGFSVTASLLLLDALVLIVACFNYANLAAATALRRSREIALRKIVGASRRQLVLQSLMESAVLGLVAFALALILVAVVRPLLHSVLPVELRLTELGRPIFWLFSAGIVLAAALLAGAYPALVESRLRAAEALRSDSGRGASTKVFRALVAAQFSAAGLLIVMVVVIQTQNRHMMAALPALLANPTIVVTTSTVFMGVNTETLRAELKNSPYIRFVGMADNEPWTNMCCQAFNLARSPDPSQPQIQAAGNSVAYDYFDAMGSTLLAGRILSREQGDELGQADVWSGRRVINIVVDRRFASRFGWSNPADAVGKVLYRPALWGGVPGTLRIVGVIESSAPRLTTIESMEANLYLLLPPFAGFTILRIDPHHVREAVAHLDSTWRSVAPHLPLEWRFLDELFGETYATFSMISTIATAIAGFAFALALMGLAGMAIHVTTGRLREVGVRKALGAQPRQIVELLLLDFAKPIVIANVLAWPFAWLGARAYLGMFQSPIGLTPVPFVASIVATVAIVCVAVGGQALRAARVEPAAVLRYQ
jgi:putative ABC transport system permease protein